MPRPSKGPHLYYRKPKGKRPAVYTIRDGGRELSTRTVDRGEAEEALRRYLIERDAPGPIRRADDVTVSEVLARYGEEHAPNVADAVRIGYAMDALDAWWGDLPVSSVSKDTCKKYAAERGVSPGHDPSGAGNAGRRAEPLQRDAHLRGTRDVAAAAAAKPGAVAHP